MFTSVTHFVKDFLCGFKDSLLGFTTIGRIDECVSSERKNIVPQHSVPPRMSTLAMRRAARLNQSVSSEGNTVHITKQKTSVSARFTDCCLTNGVLGCLAYGIAFGIIQPSLKFCYSTLTGSQSIPFWAKIIWWILSNLYFGIALLIAKILNLLWFQDIAEVSYRKVRGRPHTEKLGPLIADLAFTLLHQTLFYFQAKCALFLVQHFLSRHLGGLVYMFHIILLHSLYTFEYKWFLMGWPIHKRLTYIENHWPYFLGFGLLQGCLSYFISSFYASTFLLSLLFPVMIVAANEAKTVPTLVDYPLHILYPVSLLTDNFFQKALRYRSYYCSWIGPPISLLSKVFLVFSHIYTPLFCIVLYVSSPLIKLLNFFIKHRSVTLICTLILIITLSCSLIVKKYYFSSL